MNKKKDYQKEEEKKEILHFKQCCLLCNQEIKIKEDFCELCKYKKMIFQWC